MIKPTCNATAGGMLRTRADAMRGICSLRSCGAGAPSTLNPGSDDLPLLYTHRHNSGAGLQLSVDTQIVGVTDSPGRRSTMAEPVTSALRLTGLAGLGLLHRRGRARLGNGRHHRTASGKTPAGRVPRSAQAARTSVIRATRGQPCRTHGVFQLENRAHCAPGSPSPLKGLL
jgi:hypothetical protein